MKTLRTLCLTTFCSTGFLAMAQFPPPAGQPGTTAIHQDSSVFVAWATGCTVERGFMDISAPELGYPTTGADEDGAGRPNEGLVSLGDGGIATLTFARPITDGPGWDFAVFENSFNNTFLELAFVEVSSNGVDFVRFPATSNTPTHQQVGSYGAVDATLIDNLAGKYRATYGTPFDLNELADSAAVDITAITHVRLVDVVGCIQDEYATYDRNGNKVNDPWDTRGPSSGYDLTGVGVIHEAAGMGIAAMSSLPALLVWPNPARDQARLEFELPSTQSVRIELSDVQGRVVSVLHDGVRTAGRTEMLLPLAGMPEGLYFVILNGEQGRRVQRLQIVR